MPRYTLKSLTAALDATCTEITSFVVYGINSVYEKYVQAKSRLATLLFTAHKATFPYPFAIHRQYQAKRKMALYTYGDTPVLSMSRIHKKGAFGDHTCIVDLGCGDGKHLLYLLAKGYSVVGVDHCPGFIHGLNAIAADPVARSLLCPSQIANFLLQDMFTIGSIDAKCVFMYQLDFSSDQYAKLIKNLHSMGVLRIVSIGFSAHEYSTFYISHQSFTVLMPYGFTECSISLARTLP